MLILFLILFLFPATDNFIDHSFDETHKKRTKEEVETLPAGKSLSSTYSNLGATPTRPRVRSKTKKMIEAEDDQALRKSRPKEKKLTIDEENDIALVSSLISYLFSFFQRLIY